MKFFSISIVVVKQSLAYMLVAVFFIVIYELIFQNIFNISSDKPVVTFFNNIFLIFFTIIFFFKSRNEFSEKLFKQKIQSKKMLYVTLLGIFARLPIIIVLLIFIAFSGEEIVKLLEDGVEMQWEGVNNLTGLDYYLNVLNTSVLVPLHEELFFRGVLFLSMLKTMSPRGAIVISSLIFALFHFHPGLYIATFILGVMLSYVFYRYGNISYSIWLHILINIQPFIFTYFGMS